MAWLLDCPSNSAVALTVTQQAEFASAIVHQTGAL